MSPGNAAALGGKPRASAWVDSGTTSTVTGTCDNDEQARGYALDLIGAGCPVILCEPSRNPERDLLPPPGWATSEPDAGVLDDYRPGRHTLALVTGHVLDGIDVDTKNGASPADVIAAATRHGVAVLGVHTTPSGGLHLLVASTGIASSANPATGVDFRGGCGDGTGRGLLYLPGSTRPKYPSGGYDIAQPVDWDALQVLDVDEQRDALWAFLSDPLVGIRPRLTAGGSAPAVSGESVPELPRDLAGKVADLDAAPVGKRSDRFHHLVGECWRAGLTQGQTVAALTPWCHAVGKYIGREAAEVARSWPKVQQGDPAAWDAPSAAVDAPGINDAEWWEERDYLTFIRQAARARMMSPSAVLGSVLCRTAVEVSPLVTLPPVIGGRGNLNLYCAVAGPSGSGKGGAEAVAEEVHEWRYPPRQPGSGEGIGHLFGRVERKDGSHTTVMHTERVYLTVDEVDTLTALSGRKGATLLPVLRTAWSGATLGHAYVDPTKRVEVKAGTYRLAMTVGVQPARAGDLFADEDGGTPQRFFWATATDPTAPEVAPDPPEGSLPWRVPSDATKGRMTRLDLDLAPVVVADLREARRQSLRAALDDNRGPGHAVYTRLKVAALLGLLDGRLGVSEDDWRLAALIMADSDQVVASVRRVLAAVAVREASRRGEAKAVEAVVIDERRTQHNVTRVAKVIARAVHRSGPAGMGRKAARKAVAQRDRATYADAGLALAVELGWVAQTTRQLPQRSLDPVPWYLPGDEVPK